MVEVYRTDNTIWDIGRHQFFLQYTRLCIRTIQNGKVLVVCFAGLYSVRDTVGNSLRFFVFITILRKIDRITFFLVCPKRFILTHGVMTDHSVCRIQNILGASIVFLQLDHFSVRIFGLKVQDIIYIGTTEFVDRLVIVTDNAQILLASAIFSDRVSQQAYKLKLSCVSILILIDHNIAETVLVIVQDFRVILQ